MLKMNKDQTDAFLTAALMQFEALQSMLKVAERDGTFNDRADSILRQARLDLGGLQDKVNEARCWNNVKE
jgi:hypothetical protein